MKIHCRRVPPLFRFTLLSLFACTQGTIGDAPAVADDPIDTYYADVALEAMGDDLRAQLMSWSLRPTHWTTGSFGRPWPTPTPIRTVRAA